LDTNGTILGIESSCDDTAAAVVKNGRLLSNIVSTQDEHAFFGGVVPELASRSHQRLIVPVVEQALNVAGISRSDLDAVAVTYGPGLAGSLLVGVSFAKALALGLGVPIIGVNHFDGHIASLSLGDHSPALPYLCLIVSGGHTQLMQVGKGGSLSLLGKTRDDAAGEAFDKVGKLLGLGFPGGPQIEIRAASGNPTFHHFPRTRLPGYDYSFSGIKTSVLYYLNSFKGQKRVDHLESHLDDICASFQQAVIDMLVEPVERASRKLGVVNLGVVGGVSANVPLRSRLEDICNKRNGTFSASAIEFSTDNAAMIAMAGYQKFVLGESSPMTLSVEPSLSIA